MNDIANIKNRENEILKKKGKMFISGIEDRLNDSLAFIKNEYENYDQFLKLVEYIEYHHSNTIKADFESLERVGYYPSIEIEMELDHAIKHALIGSYKSALSDLRRALELSVNFVYLTSEHTDKKKAINWIKSKHNTIAFSKALKQLIKHGRFEKIEASCNWQRTLQDLYMDLSSFSHNKGRLKGYKELNNLSTFSAGTSAPSIKKETIKMFCNLYIQTVQEIIVIQALYNPIILVGVPFDEKFGLDGPISGYFNYNQSKFIKNLVPEMYSKYFDELIESDDEIRNIVQYFKDLPDLSEDDINEQAENLSEFYPSDENY